MKSQCSVKRTSTNIIIGTRKQGYLCLVFHQTGFDSMSGIALLEIDHFSADITYRTALVGHIANRHIAGDGEMACRILYDVVVAFHHTRHTGHEGKNGGNLSEIELIQTEGDILQIGGIGLFGVDLHTHTVSGLQIDMGAYLIVLAQEEVVVGIQVELLVTQCRTLRNEVEVESAIEHLNL